MFKQSSAKLNLPTLVQASAKIFIFSLSFNSFAIENASSNFSECKDK